MFMSYTWLTNGQFCTLRIYYYPLHSGLHGNANYEGRKSYARPVYDRVIILFYSSFLNVLCTFENIQIFFQKHFLSQGYYTINEYFISAPARERDLWFPKCGRKMPLYSRPEKNFQIQTWWTRVWTEKERKGTVRPFSLVKYQ